MPEPVHMAEEWGSRSLCDKILKNSGALRLPYGSPEITCRECERVFLRREKETRTLKYYSFVAGRRFKWLSK